MKKLSFTLILAIAALQSDAQCTVNANAIAGITLQCDNTQGQTNRSGVAFNPNFSLYYSIDAGSSNYPIETFDVNGTPLTDIAQAFDYRGLWWNNNTGRLEGNGYGTNGIVSHDLDNLTGYPLGTVQSLFTSNQPDGQSVGDYDYDDNEYIYYYNGMYHRYDATTNTLIGTVTLTGLPVTTNDLNGNTAFYTGCPGHEYGVYDFVNKRFYLIDKSTGAYAATSQLPLTAPAADNFKASYANGKLWLFEGSDYKWYSFEVLSACTPPVATIDTLGPLTFCQGDSVVLAGTAGTGYSYQWMESGTLLLGATDSLLTVTTSGNYSVIVSNGSCEDTSAVVSVLVNPLPVATITQNGNQLSVTGVYTAYQWLLNGNPIAGATSATYTATQNGSYSVIVTNTFGCSDTTAVYPYLSVGSLTISNLNIYPNPSDGRVSVSGYVSGGKDSEVSLAVVDLVGKVIYEEKLGVKNGLITKNLDMRESGKGTYFLVISCGSDRKVTPLTIK